MTNIQDKHLEQLKTKMVESYRKFNYGMRDNKKSSTFKGLPDSYYEERIQQFADGITFKMGKKYLAVRLTNDRGYQSAWGFINVGNPKFKEGDILKAAGYGTPALNKARGNLFEDYEVSWTGPHYLVGVKYS